MNTQDTQDTPYIIAMHAYHAGSMGRSGKTIHEGTVQEFTNRIEALVNKARIDLIEAYIQIADDEDGVVRKGHLLSDLKAYSTTAELEKK